MTPERWRQVKSALEQVLDAALPMRASRLDEVCANDTELRGEVESLLSFEETNDGSFTRSEVSATILEVLGDKSNAFEGRRIGKYKILREIGFGGMGTVFLAERADGEFDQQIAVKFLRQSFYSTSSRQRFAQERQILARLRHRFIAQLIDGGTTDDGTPYLAMEYVEGVPITEYCRVNELSIRRRLDLFRKVCEAVSFAHRNLIVHRDLKPDNILITADGIPKLLDFGIAKLLSTNEIKATVTRQQALTPEYASPEQIEGRDVTTASDIYALGIILYEILTGSHPFRRKNAPVEKIWRSIVLDEPLKPSQAVTKRREADSDVHVSVIENKQQQANGKLLKGDLDTIVLKTLRKEPERRYESVERFSQDIKAYLKGFPISARPDTFRYRAGKFLARNPLASIAVSIAVAGLLFGIVAAVYQARRANVERERAERRFNQVRTLANSLLFEINDKIDESPIRARELLVSRAVEYLDNLAEESAGDDELQSELATSYEKIGDIQSSYFNPMLGKPSESLVSNRKALEIREKLFAKDEKNVERGLAAADSRMRVGDLLMTNGNVEEARDNYAANIDLNRKLAQLEPQNQNVRNSLARNNARLGQAVLRSGSLGKANEIYLESLKDYQQLANDNPSELKFQHSVAVIYSYLTYVKLLMKDYDSALKYQLDSLAIEEKTAAADKNDALYRDGVMSDHLWLGIILREAGREPEAIAEIKKAVELETPIYEADKSNFGEKSSLADCHIDLGAAFLKNGQTAEAVKSYQTAVEYYQVILTTDERNLSAKRQLAYAQCGLADVYAKQNNFEKAAAAYRQSIEEMNRLVQIDTKNIEWQHDIALCYLNFGELLEKSGDRRQAGENFQTALPILEKLAVDSPENAVNRDDLKRVRKWMSEDNK